MLYLTIIVVKLVSDNSSVLEHKQEALNFLVIICLMIVNSEPATLSCYQ